MAVYSRTLGEVPQGRAFLEEHGITDAELWTRHRVGYCDGRLPGMLPREGAILEELTALGLLLPDGLERFIGCLVFPTCDVQGRIVTLQALRLEPSTPVTPAILRSMSLPGRQAGLWNEAAVKTHSQLILASSVLDALSAMMAGHLNVLALAGNSGLTPAEAATLSEHGVQQILLPYSDSAEGRIGMERLAQSLPSIHCLRLRLPGGHTLNSLLRSQGPQALASIMAAPSEIPSSRGGHREPLPDGFAVQIGRRRYEIRGLDRGPRRLRATVRVEQAGKLHIDTLDFYCARWRRQLAQDLTRVFADSADAVEADIAKLMALCEVQEPTPPPALPSSDPAMTDPSRMEVEAFGKDPRLFEAILGDFERCGLVGERAKALLTYLASVSRKTANPLCVLIQAGPGAGKTRLLDATTAFCPPEDLVRLTTLSSKARSHRENTSLKHKLLALQPGDGMREAMETLRQFMGAGEQTTTRHRVEGPTAVILTTRDLRIDSDTQARFFVIGVDESPEQTRAILEAQRHRHTLAGIEAESGIAALQEKHRNFQRLLRPVRVVNPYAEQLTYGENRIQSRRDQARYLDLIDSVAFVRQMQKQFKTTSDGAQQYVEVDREDIRLANELMNQLLGQIPEELSRPAHELLERLAQGLLPRQPEGPGGFPGGEAHGKGDEGGFTRRQIRELTGWSQARLHRSLNELVELEFLEVVNGRNGVQHRYRLPAGGARARTLQLGLRAVESLEEPLLSLQG